MLAAKRAEDDAVRVGVRRRQGDAFGRRPRPLGAGPHTPDPGLDSSDDGEADKPNWIGDGDIATDNRAWLSEQLGVTLGSIDPPLWRWLEDLNVRARDLDAEQAFHRAVKDAAGKRNPAGFLRHVLPGYITDQPLWREREEARKREEREDT
jgi:hypothetical protein